MPERLTEIQERLAQATPHQDLWQAAVKLFKTGHVEFLHEDDMALLSHTPTDLAYLLARLQAAEAVIELYRIAPRWPTPTALQDALTTWQEASNNG